MIFTEYDPLEEIIVGDVYTPEDVSAFFTGKNPSGFYQILEETKQDFDNLADFLSKGNIKVHRPDVYAYKQQISLPNFNVMFPMSPVAPRDQYKVIGNKILQTYTSLSDRYFDGLSYYKIFQQLFDQEYNWISQPAPMLTDLTLDDLYYIDQARTTYKEKLVDRLLWHTATMCPVGDAIIVNSQGPGTQRGLEWVKRNLPEFHFVSNEYTRLNNFGHIDHGFFMIDDETVVADGIGWVPNVLKNKKIIDVSPYITKIQPRTQYLADFQLNQGTTDLKWVDEYLENWRGFIQQVCFNLNVLVIDRHNVVFPQEIPDLFKFLKTHNIDCHVCEQRHFVYWDSGIHCSTLDLKRRGEKRSIIKLPKTFN